jgi:hypothetical protein
MRINNIVYISHQNYIDLFVNHFLSKKHILYQIGYTLLISDKPHTYKDSKDASFTRIWFSPNFDKYNSKEILFVNTELSKGNIAKECMTFSNTLKKLDKKDYNLFYHNIKSVMIFLYKIFIKSFGIKI